MKRKELIYIEIANNLEYQIKNDVLKVGDKLPSLRTIAIEKGVSLSTSSQAYLELESRGLIESRPQSGYYVSFAHKYFKDAPAVSQPLHAGSSQDPEELITAVFSNTNKATVKLSTSILSSELVPIAKLNKAIVNATRTLPDSGVNYDREGNARLKKQIAKRSVHWGGKLKEEDIITTSGCMDALAFSIQALTQRGDTIVVESPVFFGILQLARSLGLNVIELPTHPVTGIEIDALKKVLSKKKIKLCILIGNFSNPLGSCMPDENKKAVVRLLEKYNTPLIEDDLYADLYFGKQRPTSCKSYDESGIVLWCGSFSKTLAAGYRVGWVAPGKYAAEVAKTKRYHSLYCNSITHEAIGSFLEIGRYENHLRKLRQTLHRNSLHFLRCISEYFPDDTKVTHPKGGLQLWVELNKKVDTVELYNRAISQKISIVPGRAFSLQNQYTNCMKLSFGMTWNDKIESALKTLGKLSHQ